MTKKIFLAAAFKLVAICCAFAQKENFTIRIIQDSVCLPGINNTVLLKKMPFKIQVELQNLDGLYLYAAFKDSIYKIDADKEIPSQEEQEYAASGFKEIPPMCMVEESFNPDQELLISDEGWAYWFYDPKENWHRFDKEIQVLGKTVTATKSVKQFYLTELENTVKAEDVTQPLYLFFFSGKQNKNGDLIKELRRYKLKIDWK